MTLWDFEGVWQLVRRIEDRAAGRSGGFEGRARLTRDGGDLRYHEEGCLSLPGADPMRAERRYVWSPDGQGIAVRFEDGRAFHWFSLTDGPEARHACDPDTYLVRYDFASWPVWRTTWTVTGPRKDYTMVSDYTRLPK